MASGDDIPSRGSWRQKGVEVRSEERFFSFKQQRLNLVGKTSGV